MELEVLRKKAVPVNSRNVFLLEDSDISVTSAENGKEIFVYGNLSWAGEFVLSISVSEKNDRERPKYCQGCMHFDGIDNGEFECRISNGLRSLIINPKYNCRCPFYKVIDII